MSNNKNISSELRHQHVTHTSWHGTMTSSYLPLLVLNLNEYFLDFEYSGSDRDRDFLTSS